MGVTPRVVNGPVAAARRVATSFASCRRSSRAQRSRRNRSKFLARCSRRRHSERLAPSESGVLQELRGGLAECRGDLRQSMNSRVALAAFDGANVGSVLIGQLSEIFWETPNPSRFLRMAWPMSLPIFSGLGTSVFAGICPRETINTPTLGRQTTVGSSPLRARLLLSSKWGESGRCALSVQPQPCP